MLLPPNDDNNVVDDDDAMVSALTTIPEDMEDDDEVVDGDLDVLLLSLMPSLSTTQLVSRGRGCGSLEHCWSSARLGIFE